MKCNTEVACVFGIRTDKRPASTKQDHSRVVGYPETSGSFDCWVYNPRFARETAIREELQGIFRTLIGLKLRIQKSRFHNALSGRILDLRPPTPEANYPKLCDWLA